MIVIQLEFQGGLICEVEVTEQEVEVWLRQAKRLMSMYDVIGGLSISNKVKVRNAKLVDIQVIRK
ncbi:hypothetical protein JNUCC23_08870 [Peribacillus sp. JNUCC 23]